MVIYGTAPKFRGGQTGMRIRAVDPTQSGLTTTFVTNEAVAAASRSSASQSPVRHKGIGLADQVKQSSARVMTPE